MHFKRKKMYRRNTPETAAGSCGRCGTGGDDEVDIVGALALAANGL